MIFIIVSLSAAQDLADLYNSIYYHHPQRDAAFKQLIDAIIYAHLNRSPQLKQRDNSKTKDWFLSNELAGMSLYVDRFCGTLKKPSR